MCIVYCERWEGCPPNTTHDRPIYPTQITYCGNPLCSAVTKVYSEPRLPGMCDQYEQRAAMAALGWPMLDDEAGDSLLPDITPLATKEEEAKSESTGTSETSSTGLDTPSTGLDASGTSEEEGENVDGDHDMPLTGPDTPSTGSDASGALEEEWEVVEMRDADGDHDTGV